MFYREAGQFKTSYAADQQIFPILQDRIGIGVLLLIAFVVVPLIADQYWLSALLTPFLVLGLAFVFGAAAQRLRVSPLAGYLLAGILVGPFTPGFVGCQELASQLAEIRRGSPPVHPASNRAYPGATVRHS